MAYTRKHKGLGMENKAKCPKCGEIEQVEITKTWGYQSSDEIILQLARRIEIYCNTCGQVSIIAAETSDPLISER